MARLLYLRLAAARCLVVSSASMATEIFKTHDFAFASRPSFAFADELPLGNLGLFTSPYGDYWKFMKKLCMTELLSTKQLERSHGIRHEEMVQFLHVVLEKANKKEMVDVGNELMKLTNNIVCRMLMSTRCSEKGDEADRITELVKESFEAMDLTMRVYQDDKAEVKITRIHIKALLLDLFAGGTGTAAEAMQWTIAELMNNPEETLRLYPPGPIAPRECRQSCKIKGFDVPQKTMVIVNLYAIMRDPDLWDNPNEFRPERFLVSSKEQDNLAFTQNETKEPNFGFIPFGGGRKSCPGSMLALSMMHCTIASMVQCFDWNLGGAKISMQVGGGFSLPMAHPLICLPVVHFNPFASSR
uniref:Cytochrome P450 n=1 Tax=Fagus sylvatica TaxID=28930 RepID=A0A2N9G2Q2_FAGSY